MTADNGIFSLAPAASVSVQDTLRGALLDSRQRWRDLVTLGADLAFETDADGRLVFLHPDPAMGWPAGTLLGQPASTLLLEPGAPGQFDPFNPIAPVRRRRAWLRRPDGKSVLMSFAVAPLLEPSGRSIGARGLGYDITAEDGADADTAALLRRSAVIDDILWRMRQEVLAPRMMQVALEALGRATGAAGLAVVDLLGDGTEPVALHKYGEPEPVLMAACMGLCPPGGTETVAGVSANGHKLLICPTQTRFGMQIGLLLWRQPEGRAWDRDEHALAGAAALVARVILEHETIQREMARQARTDPLTGLLNRRAFLDEVARRMDRLERDGLPGTLMFVDLDHFKALNDVRGHDAGDHALRSVGAFLRDAVRPTDLVARLGGDEFALWLDTADELAAAERAERLTCDGPRALAAVCGGLPQPVTLSVGLATRWPGDPADLDTLMERADEAMYQVKRSGRGRWRAARRIS